MYKDQAKNKLNYICKQMYMYFKKKKKSLKKGE